MANNPAFLISLVLAATGLIMASASFVVAVDRRRIARHMEPKGLKIHYLKWRPFKRATMGENMLREYDVICEDASGSSHHYLVRIAWLVAPEIRTEEIE
jgi:hypothetical protein